MTKVTFRPSGTMHFCGMEIAGYFASLLIGISLGLIGGGGSILTVPVLVYLFNISPGIAISYSLFIVGLSSLVGAFNNFRKGLVDIRIALLFGSSSVATVFLTRKFLVPQLPDVFFHVGSFAITHSIFVMVMFAILMVITSISMIKSRAIMPPGTARSGPAAIGGYGVLVGLITGFLGAGGGFLLIPALVILLRTPIKIAIGTSLLIIALNSSIGFVADIGRYPVDWTFISLLSIIAITGIFIGGYFNQKINPEKLKKSFGVFILLTGTYILLRELLPG